MSTSGKVEIEVRNQIRQKNATICSKASVLANNLRFELEDGALLMKFNTAVNLVDYDLWIWNSSVLGGETSWVECGQHRCLSMLYQGRKGEGKGILIKIISKIAGRKT